MGYSRREKGEKAEKGERTGLHSSHLSRAAGSTWQELMLYRADPQKYWYASNVGPLER